MLLTLRLIGSRKRPTLFWRLMGISMSLLTLTLLALTGAEHYENENDIYSQAARNLPAQLTYISQEMRVEGVAENILPLINFDQSQPGENLFALCSADDTTAFRSKAMIAKGLAGPCHLLPDTNEGLSRAPITLEDGQPYYFYPTDFQTEGGLMRILVLRDATEAAQALQLRNQRANLKLIISIPTVLCLLIFSAAWGIKPLKKLGRQLNEIIAGTRTRLDTPEARELEDVTFALNDLLEQADNRRETYQKAMKDLAHSLKTRLAATQAILDEMKMENGSNTQELYHQLEQMDHLVQYQLRRAVMGRQGLTHQRIDIRPVAEQLASMLSKIHQHRAIQCQLEIDPTSYFPGNQEDLMELLGNLMENAHRFAVNLVQVSATITSDNKCEICVEDDGPGIEPELRNRVLRRGERADERHPGQGLGLAVCNELVHSYGGRLMIDQSDFQGARIRILIPLPNFSQDK